MKSSRILADITSSPVVGSSRMTMCGAWITVRAIAHFWRMPVESWSARLWLNSCICSWSNRLSQRCLSRAGAMPCRRPKYSTFSRALRRPYSPVLPDKKPIRLRASSGSARMSSPLMVARPASGRSAVDRMRSVVVLPAPFGPSRPSTSPGAHWNDTSRTAWNQPSCSRTSRWRARRSLWGVVAKRFARPNTSIIRASRG